MARRRAETHTQPAWDARQLAAFNEMVREDGHLDAARYTWAARNLLGSIDLHGKRVLEIGSGGGLRTVFMALQGAHSIVSLEPGLAGARQNSVVRQRKRLDRLGLANVELLDADFNVWDARSREFDVVVSESSINHLHESGFHALHHEPTYRAFHRICTRIHHLLVPGGVACISDACRYSFFSALRRFGVPRPWTGKPPSAIWWIHQNPGVWRRILLDAGFVRVDVDYPRPHRLRHFGPLVTNPVSNFFLRGYFYLRATR